MVSGRPMSLIIVLGNVIRAIHISIEPVILIPWHIKKSLNIIFQRIHHYWSCLIVQWKLLLRYCFSLLLFRNMPSNSLAISFRWIIVNICLHKMIGCKLSANENLFSWVFKFITFVIKLHLYFCRLHYYFYKV